MAAGDGQHHTDIRSTAELAAGPSTADGRADGAAAAPRPYTAQPVRSPPRAAREGALVKAHHVEEAGAAAAPGPRPCTAHPHSPTRIPPQPASQGASVEARYWRRIEEEAGAGAAAFVPRRRAAPRAPPPAGVLPLTRDALRAHADRLDQGPQAGLPPHCRRRSPPPTEAEVAAAAAAAASGAALRHGRGAARRGSAADGGAGRTARGWPGPRPAHPDWAIPADSD